MALFNYATKEITLKVVYYGPGLSGKTTNLQYLYSILGHSSRGKFISLSTESDRTLFFDFLPVDLGKIKDFSLRFQLYTVPGQIRYNATRRLVLKGADAVVFVADSQQALREQNIESFENMKENLISNHLDPDSTPIVLQYNKRDLPDILSVEDLNYDLNSRDYQHIEAEAVNGRGVMETFNTITKQILTDISKKYKVSISTEEKEEMPFRTEEKSAPEVEEPLLTGEPLEQEAISPLQPLTQQTVEQEAGQPITQQPPTYMDEKINYAVDSVNRFSKDFMEIRATINTILLEEIKSNSQELKELKKQQIEISRTLMEIKDLLDEVAAKRGWFRFFSR